MIRVRLDSDSEDHAPVEDFGVPPGHDYWPGFDDGFADDDEDIEDDLDFPYDLEIDDEDA